MSGAEITTPSRTMATWLRGGCELKAVVVSLPTAVGALALEVELDEPLAGAALLDPGGGGVDRRCRPPWPTSRTYLEAAVGLAGGELLVGVVLGALAALLRVGAVKLVELLEHRRVDARWVHVRHAGRSGPLAGGRRLRRRSGARARLAAGVALLGGFVSAGAAGTGVGLGERRRQGLTVAGGGRAARPVTWSTGRDRLGRLPDAVGESARRTVSAPGSAPRSRAACGSCAGRIGHHLAEAQLRGGADQLDDLLLPAPGIGDDDVVAGLGDLGVGDADAVDPVPDDVHRAVQDLLGSEPAPFGVTG